MRSPISQPRRKPGPAGGGAAADDAALMMDGRPGAVGRGIRPAISRINFFFMARAKSLKFRAGTWKAPLPPMTQPA